MFLWWCNIHEMVSFGGFLVPFSPKYGSRLQQSRPDLVFHKTKTVSEQSERKIKCLCGNGTYPKSTVLVHFWAQFTQEKPKILPKTKIFPETTFLWLSYNTSPKSQMSHRIVIKLVKIQPFFWPKMDFLR